MLNRLQQEEAISKRTLHLTANENIMSQLALSFCSSELGYRYHVGSYDDAPDLTKAPYYITHNLMLRNLPSVFALEKIARHFACEMFHATYCDFRPLSGMHAAFSILLTTTKPQDTVYIFSTESVGHHATLSLLKHLGRKIQFIPWDFSSCNIDLHAFASLVKSHPPSVVFFDFGTTFFPLPLKEMRAIVGEGPLMIYDGSHVLGLIAGGQFQAPLEEGCDILIGNTHKTFPGPQKGMLLYKNSFFGREIADELFLSVLSTQHTHHSIALYLTLIEMHQFAKDYATQILTNREALAQALIEEGFQVHNSQSHKLALIGGPFHEECALLHQNQISTNSRKLFDAPSIRMGVQEATRKGMKEREMIRIAKLIRRCLDGENVKRDVEELLLEFSTTWEGNIYENMHLYRELAPCLL
ncbi:MAG: hypothetical protein COT84_01565 [Chlamydiae bacterium CG10_big_fil_rev_8_21_14_0_10_35_9]|nr:MAG: hypothetical protein COT84_01565 [Chlamydiae bacterium CG10_big_fil_rev_8_21_14_0_10_35_9]